MDKYTKKDLRTMQAWSLERKNTSRTDPHYRMVCQASRASIRVIQRWQG